MVRVIVFLLPLALTIYAVVNCVQTDEDQVRGLPKLFWVLLIVLAPPVGAIAWLLAGRPERLPGGAARGMSPSPHRQPTRSVPPDDDPEFLAQLGPRDEEHERMLKQWEENLRRRERELRRHREENSPEDGDGRPR